MRFVDLFAGLGGFHLALAQMGHECVYASELNKALRSVYKMNFGLEPQGDIREVSLNSIPEHEILCAGFPCQPFSKAGEQAGFGCPKWGDLFDRVLAIARHRVPTYLLLENVANLEKHDRGKTWAKIKASLEASGYTVQQKRLSPHRFGIPQVRDRIFIVGSLEGLDGFEWPELPVDPHPQIATVLERSPADARPLSRQVAECLEIWQDFLRRFPADDELPSFPIWSMEFGATYPYEDTTPHAIGVDRLCEYKGCHGAALRTLEPDTRLLALPSYARAKDERFPQWKVQFIRQNRCLYQEHRSWIDEWLPGVLCFPPSLQKFEWNCKGEERDVWRYVVQFRASGVRVKRPTTAPSLIAMTTTQVPIIAWERRYMTPRECARLQSMEGLKQLPSSATEAYKALGNAVNVSVVRRVAEALLGARRGVAGQNSGADQLMSVGV